VAHEVTELHGLAESKCGVGLVGEGGTHALLVPCQYHKIGINAPRSGQCIQLPRPIPRRTTNTNYIRIKTYLETHTLALRRSFCCRNNSPDKIPNLIYTCFEDEQNPN
jgi:hypothetical protein